MTATRTEITPPWTFAEPWGGTSRIVDLDGPVHWVDFGGPRKGTSAASTPIVLVHGLGGSHLNWVRIAPALAKHTRVMAVDLGGFGLTSGANRSTSVSANAALLERFIREVAGGRAVLIGNSMGGMVSVLLAATHPQSAAGLILIDPSVPVPRRVPDLQVTSQFLLYAVPFLGERYMAMGYKKRSDREVVQRVVDVCFADPTRADSDVLHAAASLAKERRSMPNQEAHFLQAARSLMLLLGRPRHYQALIRRVRCPVLLIHGERDRLVPVAAARKVAAANPEWETAFLPDVGHTPQLEAPEVVVDLATDWLQRHDLVSVRRRR